MQEAHPPKLRARRAQEQPVHLRGTDSQQRRDITQSRWHPVPYMFGGFLPRHPNTLPTLQGLEGCPLSTAHLLGPSHPCLSAGGSAQPLASWLASQVSTGHEEASLQYTARRASVAAAHLRVELTSTAEGPVEQYLQAPVSSLLSRSLMTQSWQLPSRTRSTHPSRLLFMAAPSTCLGTSL